MSTKERIHALEQELSELQIQAEKEAQAESIAKEKDPVLRRLKELVALGELAQQFWCTTSNYKACITCTVTSCGDNDNDDAKRLKGER